jgi:hypothetical protein
VVKGGSAAAAIILFIAYVAIPVVIVTGILKR